jgi:hypothetical protein
VEFDQAAPLAGPLSFDQGKIKVIGYGPDRLVTRVSAMQNAFLVIANNWNKYWRCRVDGVIRECLRVNHTQIGVVVEAGEHVVTLTYEPPYLSWKTLFQFCSTFRLFGCSPAGPQHDARLLIKTHHHHE